jgi:hypothetical protein
MLLEAIRKFLFNLIFGAAIAAVSVATPALPAHKGKPISAHQNGYVTRSGQGSGVYNFLPVPRTVYDPGARPYRYDPNSAISYPEGEPGGNGG